MGTNTTSLELIKLLFNSVLSWRGGWFSFIDLKSFYLDTPMPNPKYVCIKITNIPKELIEEYKLEDCNHDGWMDGWMY